MTVAPLCFECILTAEGAGSSAVRVLDTGRIVDCILDGETQDILVQDASTAQVEGNVFDTSTLTGSGVLESLQGDRSAFDALNYAARHTNDADDSATAIHHTLGTGADQAAAGNHTHSAPSLALDDLTDVTITTPSNGDVLTYDTGAWVNQAGGSGTDTDAIHVNVASEIHGITEKTTPADADEIVIEDSADSYNKKRVKIENLPSGGGGAPDTAKYITAAADAGLSAEIVIPGLAGSPDIAGAAGAGTSEEYDTATTGLTWNNTPTTVDSNTTIKSHLYILNQADTTERLGTKAWSPAGAFDARARVCTAMNGAAVNAGMCGLHIANSDDSIRLLCQLSALTSGYLVAAYTYTGGTYTGRGTNHIVGVNDIYYRITRDGSNNCSFYWSTNGLVWQLIATQSHTLTVAKIGFRIQGSNSGTSESAIDWLRTDV